MKKDKTLKELESRFNAPIETTDYFLYSLVNVIKYKIKEKS